MSTSRAVDILEAEVIDVGDSDDDETDATEQTSGDSEVEVGCRGLIGDDGRENTCIRCCSPIGGTSEKASLRCCVSWIGKAVAIRNQIIETLRPTSFPYLLAGIEASI